MTTASVDAGGAATALAPTQRDPAAAFVEAFGLSKTFDVSAPWLSRTLERQPRRFLRAVDDVSFAIERGRTLALVGESGCGKSTVARLLVGLQRPTAGQVCFDGREAHWERGGTPGLRRRVQMIFQDPYASLNPRWTVADIVTEPWREHGVAAAGFERAARRRPEALRARASELLQSVGLHAADGHKFPHQFSGGQRQRISIARALASEPEFIVCDEPTSALDVSVQAQVLNLMKDLQRRRGLTYLFISHNLAVVRHISDAVGVMYLGRIVELTEKRQLFAAPRHPYTRMLLQAVPDISRRRSIEAVGPNLEMPNPLQAPSGCAFHSRCRYADARCREERPALRRDSEGAVACHAIEEGRLGAGVSVVE